MLQIIEHASHVTMKVFTMQLGIEVDLTKREERLSLERSSMRLLENSAIPRRWVLFA